MKALGLRVPAQWAPGVNILLVDYYGSLQTFITHLEYERLGAESTGTMGARCEYAPGGLIRELTDIYHKSQVLKAWGKEYWHNGLQV